MECWEFISFSNSTLVEFRSIPGIFGLVWKCSSILWKKKSQTDRHKCKEETPFTCVLRASNREMTPGEFLRLERKTLLSEFPQALVKAGIFAEKHFIKVSGVPRLLPWVQSTVLATLKGKAAAKDGMHFSVWWCGCNKTRSYTQPAPVEWLFPQQHRLQAGSSSPDTVGYRELQAVLCKGSAGCAQAHRHGKAAPPSHPLMQTGPYGLRIWERCTGVFLSSAPWHKSSRTKVYSLI